jgi:O-antigen ligase/polysaccharide polymerase Wzy-like membrane protein
VSRPAQPGFPASLALCVLVAIAVLAPWLFGAVQPRALLAVAALALVTAAVALASNAGRGVMLPAVPLWPLAGFLALALLQLVPLPGALHGVAPPGSYAVWRPSAPEVAAVLGSGPRPVSVDPNTTLRGVALTGGLALLAFLAAPAFSRPLAAARALALLAAGGVALSALRHIRPRPLRRAALRHDGGVDGEPVRTVRRQSVGAVVLLVLAGALGAILVALVPPEAHERIRSLSGASFRFDTWRDSLRLAAASPLLGHGLGAFHDAYPRFKQGHEIVRVEHAENDYVETLAETGASGRALAVLGLVLLLAAAGKGIASAPDRAVRGIAAGAVAALAALAVHSSVDFNLRIPSNAALAALAAAAGAAGLRPRPLPRAGALALAAGAVALLAAVLLLPDRPWIAAREQVVQAASASAPAVRRLRLERAAVALERQLGRRPAQAESWLLLGGTRAALGEAAAGKALARHAAWLDPGRTGLAEAVDRLSSAPAAPAP